MKVNCKLNRAEKSASSIRHALTLVELIVVISIIGVLVGMLLPAIYAAREAARVATCKNNLKQIGLAMHAFSDSQRRFPGGGWGYNWQGFSDIGGDLGQPGAWTFSLLPFIEQPSLYHTAIYISTNSLRDAELRKRIVVPVAIYNCPSRRSPETFAVNCTSCGTPLGIVGRIEATTRSDYAANIGDGAPGSNLGFWPLDFAGPFDLEESRLLTRLGKWPQPPIDWTGISYLRIGVRLAGVTDGLSNVIMIGEKYVDRREYRSGKDWGDNEVMFSGFNNDNHRSTNPVWKYSRDRSGMMSIGSFGSAHTSGNFVLCDGSVHTFSYDIDTVTFRLLGNRRDGNTISIE